MADTDHITTQGKSPAFQFYPSDFYNGTIALSAEEVGAYIRLLCHQWDKGALPIDLERLARISGVPLAKMRRVWFHLQSFFVMDGDGLVNARLERVRQTQIEYRRRQTDNGKKGGRPKAAPIPTETQALPTPNPNESSPVSGLHSSERKKDLRASDPVEELAGAFMEQYPAVFARCRDGAAYHTSRVNMDRDLGYARELAKGWPSLPRLLEMLEVFLLAKKIGDKNSPGTPGQFLHMAPEMDALLRQNGR